jgi:V/A-type H+-transporting ATPase subunit I
MLRPVATRWFELLVLRQDFGRAMDCAARTGVVQLEARAAGAGALGRDEAALADLSRRFEALRGRYEGYWPAPEMAPFMDAGSLADRFSEAIGYLDDWAETADSVVSGLRATRQEIDALDLLRALFDAGASRLPHLGGFRHAGAHVAAYIGSAPAPTPRPDPPEGVIVEDLAGDGRGFLLAIGPAPAIAELSARADQAGWAPLRLPDWLPSPAQDAADEIARRLSRCRAERDRLEARLDDLNRRHGLAEALGTVAQIDWLIGCARDVEERPRLKRITGWALEPEIPALEAGLAGCGVFHVLAFPPPPPGAAPPVVLFNPHWARRFEALTRMIGLPTDGEADPTVIVALVAPLLFGFMFGDVGQGAVLLAAGLLLRNRVPPLAMLIPGGAMAMVFGVLFGSVFGREDIIPALWLHPLDEPILLLGISIAAGAVILLTGLLIRALQSRWQGRWRTWVLHEAGLVVCYLGLLGAVVWGWAAIAVAGFGAAWYVLGAAVATGPRTALTALAELVETILQLLVNTVSFARAGAFALAHAGLSVAIVGLADASGPLFYLPVLVLGNAFVLALEGLVVGIQTTRLLLFEFFIRFLTGGGREFRPLVPPGGLQGYAKEAT